MTSITDEIETGLEMLNRHLSDLRGTPPPLPPKPVAGVLTHLKEPWARALSELPGTYTMLLANLELLLSEVCNAVDSEAIIDAHLILDDPKPGYWTAGTITQGVADTAVKIGILDDHERDRLLEARVWDNQACVIQECVNDLEESIALVSGLFEKLKTRL